LVNAPLVENVTNPMCRAAYLGHKSIVAILIKYGGDINLRSSDGRTPLMWAAFRNNVLMAEYLMDNGAQVDIEDNEGWNSLDLAVIKMNYDVALLLKRRGMVPREKEMYLKNLWQEYDLDMFLRSLEEDIEKVEYERFFELPKSKLVIQRLRELIICNF
jgi:hypothetical protein